MFSLAALSRLALSPKFLVLGISLAFTVGAAAGGYAAKKWYKAAEVSALEAQLEELRAKHEVAESALDDFYERQVQIEKDKTYEFEANRPECALSPADISVLNRTRRGLP